MKGVTPYSKELSQKYKKAWLGITMIDAFERACDITPEKVAVIESETKLTFAQLWEKVQSAALAFSNLGLKKNDIVLLQIPNGLEAVYVYLALNMIGVVPVVCIPRHGQRELERFGRMTGAKAWLGAAGSGKLDYTAMAKVVKENTPSLRNIIVVRGEVPPGTVSLSHLMGQNRPTLESDAYLRKLRPSPKDVLHLAPTGGTTGLPKLVPRIHNAHLCKAYYWARTAERGPREVDLVAPIYHDAPHLSHLTFLALFGGTLVFCPTLKATDIVEHLERHQITFCFMTPTLLADLASLPGVEQRRFSGDLKLGTGGAWAPSKLVRTVCRRYRCRFYNIYGMTEGAGTITRLTDPLDVVSTTVGKGMCPYDKYKVVDEDDNERLPGKDGEIVVLGPSIVTGYYKSREEDERVFTRDGFFRTGDVGKFDSRGNLIITGRKKDLIRRGGEAIIPFEIEEMLIEHPKVVRAAVVGMPDVRLGERICAYVQLLPGETVTFEEILAFLKEKGASAMLLPERMEILQEFPFTPVQKVDKQALRDDIAAKIRLEQEDGR
jgi:2,3-dihydroxybenzoate-AMP ligase